MAATSKWLRENIGQVMAVAVGALVMGASVYVGSKARSANRELETRRLAWQETANQLATVQQQFKAPSSNESAALIAESSRLGSLAVTPEDRLVLVDAVGRLAEACGLRRIRVNSVQRGDTLFARERSLPGGDLHLAEYALDVEFEGGFAGVVQFVNTLPPSVSVSRLGAMRRPGGATYQVILSVYEFDGKPAS